METEQTTFNPNDIDVRPYFDVLSKRELLNSPKEFIIRDIINHQWGIQLVIEDDLTGSEFMTALTRNLIMSLDKKLGKIRTSWKGNRIKLVGKPFEKEGLNKGVILELA